MGLLVASLDATAAPASPLVDGRWRGDTGAGLGAAGLERCWASTSVSGGTTLTLSERKDGTWYLELSNSAWRFATSHSYVMVALVDFYPRLRLAARATGPTVLEFADIEDISLLEFIENGHTIDLASDSLNAKYELEGSAKIIQRIRACFGEQSADRG